jgi:enoyl-CoA hydratase
MTMSELATYELDGGIATITMDDGKVNALSPSMLRAIHAAFDQAEQDGAVVVLTGREAFFSAGFDLEVFAGGEADRVVEMLRLGATVPWFAIELARQRLQPAAFSRAVINANMYRPVDAASAGFLDRVVGASELRAASLEDAAQLAELNADAHIATKLRARAGALAAVRSAIETELTVEGLQGASAPQ